MYKYITNPLNKKKVNIKSKLGKKILQNYLNLKTGSGHAFGLTPKIRPEVTVSHLEKIDEEEAIPTLSESQKLCSIKGIQICKDIAPGFQSPFNILNYISHDKHLELNDINFEASLYEKIDIVPTDKKGRYGSIVDNIFENKKTKQIIVISEKIIHSDLVSYGKELDEIKLLARYPFLTELCPHIIPIKILDDKVYMLRGTGDLNKLIQSTEIDINAGIAHQIVNCIKKTLLCLLEYDIYYFDLKPGNIIYQCFNDTMYIWLIDLGSMLPDDKDGSYLATYPHPIINCLSSSSFSAGIITKNVYGANLTKKKSHERIKDIYAYQLSQLFFNLLDLNVSFEYKYITKNKPPKLSKKLQKVIKKVEQRGYKYRLIKNYVGVFKEIINGIQEMESGRDYPNPCHEEFWL